MFSPTNKQVLSFLNGSACRVESDSNGIFNFYGLKPDKPCISVPAQYMTEMCNQLYAAKERLKLTVAVRGNDTVVASYPIFKAAADNTEVVFELQTYNGSASIWLKKFRLADGQRRGCPGWVMFNDMEATTLHEFYTKCNPVVAAVVKPF